MYKYINFINFLFNNIVYNILKENSSSSLIPFFFLWLRYIMHVCILHSLINAFVCLLSQNVPKRNILHHPYTHAKITISTSTLMSQMPHQNYSLVLPNRIRAQKYTFDLFLTYVHLIITLMLEIVLKCGPPLHLFIFCSGGSHYVTLLFGQHARGA